jgi:small-conductance mechanosensitive channel
MFLKSNDEFIEELTKMYDSCRDKSSVWVTFKRVIPKEKKPKKEEKIEDKKKEKPKRTLPEGSLYVRAKTDKKKFATGVLLKDLVKFQVNLAVLCKNKMQGGTKPILEEKVVEKIEKEKKVEKKSKK